MFLKLEEGDNTDLWKCWKIYCSVLMQWLYILQQYQGWKKNHNLKKWF